MCIGELPQPDRSAVEALDGRIQQLPRLADCLKQGDHPDEVVLVLSGMLYRYTIGHQGARQVHSFYLPTEAPCLETLYMDYMDNNLGAVVDSRVAFIPHPDLYAVIDEFPEARKLLWRQTLVQGGIFREWLIRNSNQTAQAALAHLLCELYTRAQAARLVENDSMDLPLTQQFVAEALGLTPVHVNRSLQILRESGCFEWERGRRLRMIDFKRLQAIAEFDAGYLHLRC
jgi:CRP-like cAMP-binding protein